MEYIVDCICAQINEGKTKEKYNSLPNNMIATSADLNFRKNILMRKENIEEYLSPMGIDCLKYQGLSVVSINQPLQSVTYCGYYPLEAENEVELKSIICTDDYADNLLENVTDFGFDFGFEFIDSHIVLSFWTVLPWLFMPPISKCSFDNKTALPKIKLFKTVSE